MTPLIDHIEQAFVEGREQWLSDDCVDTEALVDRLAMHGVSEIDAEGACVTAFTRMRQKWGRDWAWQTGDVAEEIMSRLPYPARAH